MVPVSQLDHHHPQIARHGDQHLAEIFCLRFLVGVELHLVQLGQAIDQLADLFAEELAQLVLAGTGVFHGVVQQGGTHRVGIHAPVHHGAGDG